MDVRLHQELVLYRRRVYHFKERYPTQVTLDSVVELTTIIPEKLVSGSRTRHTPFIQMENNFEDVIHYLNWLDSLYKTVEARGYFTTEQHNALTEHRELTLESFLINSNGMMYYPYVILENIRSKLMRLNKEIESMSTKDGDLQDYYKRRIKGFMVMISQPAFAIGELAGFKDE